MRVACGCGVALLGHGAGLLPPGLADAPLADPPLADPPLADPSLALARSVVSRLGGGDACWDEDW